jgi:putative radical SAM enzyme (TIGR03279 family)
VKRDGSQPKKTGGLVSAVRPGSTAAKIGIREGDRLLQVNDHPVADVLDVQYHAAEDTVRLTWQRGGRILSGRAQRGARSPLGLEFAHPTFDTDIRRCNNRCPFCFVVQMAPGMRRTLHIKDDDYRYSFLYGHFVTLTNLHAADWKRIAAQRLSPLYVSVHATELDVRIRCLGNPQAGEILGHLRFLADRGIQIHTQVVLIPGWNDGAHLDRTLADLAELFPNVRSCSVVPVGVTKYQQNGIRPYVPAAMNPVIRQVENRQEDFLRRLGSRFAFLTDEWYLATGRDVPPVGDYEEIDLRENGLGLTRSFLEDWAARRAGLAARQPRLRRERATLVTARLFQSVLQSAAEEFSRLTGTRLEVVGTVNRCFGETVTVAGLLTGRDVIDAVRSAGGTGPVLLPRAMFSAPPLMTLDDLGVRGIASETKRTIFLADTMEDVEKVMRG